MNKDDYIKFRTKTSFKKLLKDKCKELNISMSRFITTAIIKELKRIERNEYNEEFY